MDPLLACVDVDYAEGGATAACVGFAAWTDAIARIEIVVRAPGPPASYQPGAFYERELPHLLAVLARMPPVGVVIVDAYVWLGPARPGLGARLHEARGGAGAVIGVAKTRFAAAGGGGAHDGAAEVVEVRRGGGDRPLYVTAIGMPAGEAARQIERMHGEHRIPTMLRRVDALARGRAMQPVKL